MRPIGRISTSSTADRAEHLHGNDFAKMKSARGGYADFTLILGGQHDVVMFPDAGPMSDDAVHADGGRPKAPGRVN
jgi:hypothetical protein